MAIKDIDNLANRVSKKDRDSAIERFNLNENPPEFNPDFDSSSSDLDDFEEDDSFAPSFGNSNSIGNDLNIGMPSLGQNFNMPMNPYMQGMQNNTQTQQEDTFDIMFKKIGAFLSCGFRVLHQIVKSIPNRTLRDYSAYFATIAFTGIGAFVLGLILKLFGVNSIFVNTFLVTPFFLWSISITGILFIYIKGYIKPELLETNKPVKLSSLEDNLFEEDSYNDSIENNFIQEDELDEDIFESENEDLSDFDKGSLLTSVEEEEKIAPEIVEVDKKEVLSELDTMLIKSKKQLLDIFSPVLQNCTNLTKAINIEKGSNRFYTLHTLCEKAIKATTTKKGDEVNTFLESAIDALFYIEMRMTRVKGLNNCAAIAKSIDDYFKGDDDDPSVYSVVTVDGDFYKIRVYKGTKALITIKDILDTEKGREHFENSKVWLPFVLGVLTTGEPIFEDMKNVEAMLITGIARSGKSWYLFSVLNSLCFFNSPEDIQFALLDPKASATFTLMAKLPHVFCHSTKVEDYIEVIETIMNTEGERRKKLLVESGFDNIWEFKQANPDVKIPIIYIVIDELATVKNTLSANKENEKKFDSILSTLVTKLPYIGIRLIVVPHRATEAMISKTLRTMIPYKICVKGDSAQIEETTGDKKFPYVLATPGDLALIQGGQGTAKCAKTPVLSCSDEENRKIIEFAIKAWYKIGFELPYMALKSIETRNIEKVREELLTEESEFISLKN